MLRSFQSRSLAVCSILVIGLSGLSARLIQIQLVDRQRYAEGSWKTYHHIEILRAERGNIVDCNDEVLARSVPVFAVMVDLAHLTDPDIAAYGLAWAEASQKPDWKSLDSRDRRKAIFRIRSKILQDENSDAIVEKHLAYAIGVLARPLGMRREEVREKIDEKRANGGKGTFALAKDLPGDIADPLQDAIEQSGICGFQLQNALKRIYTAPTVAAHVLGYGGEKEEKNDEGKTIYRFVGKTGVEASMEAYMAGRDGWREHWSDSRGLPMPGDAGSLCPPKPGLNVQLTLDMGIQSIVEEEMDAAMKEYNASRAAAIVMDPKTGAILAMVSRPNFDLNVRDFHPNSRDGVKTNAGFNYALQAAYEPGSTFKIISSSGSLNEGLVTPQTQIFCNNGFLQESSFFIKDDSSCGMLTVEGILQKSSNIGAYKLARQLGTDRFYHYVHDYGFGRKTGILLSGESSGRVRNSVNPVDFSRSAFGYSLSVTPLQVVTAYSAIASDGKLRKPRIVNAVIANDGSVVERFAPEVVGSPIKPETARKMRAALEKVIEKGGTATLAAVPGHHVAGKTGTAKLHNPNGKGYLDGRYTVSFVGMLPAEDPKFVAVIVIEDPRTSKVTIFGGTIAAPTFGKMAARIANAMNLQPTEPVETPASRTAAR